MDIDFAELLLEVVDRRASDLHLTAGAPQMVRVRGRLQAVDGYPTLTPTDTREIVYSILSNDQRQKLENNWQLDFAYQIPGRARFRVNAYFQRSALGAAFRLIPFEIAPLDSLGLPPSVAEFANRPRGLVLVTGPTGSGKSTTLASLVDVINETREEHIMTTTPLPTAAPESVGFSPERLDRLRLRIERPAELIDAVAADVEGHAAADASIEPPVRVWISIVVRDAPHHGVANVDDLADLAGADDLDGPGCSRPRIIALSDDDPCPVQRKPPLPHTRIRQRLVRQTQR